LEQAEETISFNHSPVLYNSNRLIVKPSGRGEAAEFLSGEFSGICILELSFKFLTGNSIFYEAVTSITTSRIDTHAIPYDGKCVINGSDKDILVEDVIPGILDRYAKGPIATSDLGLKSAVVDSIRPRLIFNRPD
jgi:hypothetical protein